MKKYSTIYLLLPVLTLILFSGCTKKEVAPSPGETPNLTDEISISTSTEENIPVWPEQIYSENDYIGWKTYTNEKLGYKIKYPSDWTINACDEGCASKEVIINPPDAELFTSYISIGLESRDIKGIRSVYLNSDYQGGTPYKEEIVYFSSKKSYHFFDGRLKEIEKIKVFFNQKFYSISTQRVDNKKVLQALASFEFIY